MMGSSGHSHLSITMQAFQTYLYTPRQHYVIFKSCDILSGKTSLYSCDCSSSIDTVPVRSKYVLGKRITPCSWQTILNLVLRLRRNDLRKLHVLNLILRFRLGDRGLPYHLIYHDRCIECGSSGNPLVRLGARESVDQNNTSLSNGIQCSPCQS